MERVHNPQQSERSRFARLTWVTLLVVGLIAVVPAFLFLQGSLLLPRSWVAYRLVQQSDGHLNVHDARIGLDVSMEEFASMEFTPSTVVLLSADDGECTLRFTERKPILISKQCYAVTVGLMRENYGWTIVSLEVVAPVL